MVCANLIFTSISPNNTTQQLLKPTRRKSIMKKQSTLIVAIAAIALFILAGCGPL